MAYIGQEKKAKVAAALKAFMPKTWKYTLGVNHHSTLMMNIAAAPVDILAIAAANTRHAIDRSHFQLNPYYWRDHLNGAPEELLDLIGKIFDALNDGNHNRSDLMSDYHDVGWYVDVNFGKWNKPFLNTAPKTIWNDDGTNGPVLICAPPANMEAAA